MVIWFKQIFRRTRYFIVVYQYRLNDGTTGQGQCTITTKGTYFSVKQMVNEFSEDFPSGVDQFILLNVMELNRRDFECYKQHSKYKENES